GTETLPNGQLVGEYKDGKPWNVKGYDKERNITGKWVNGVKQK
ncbi:MAG TPA: membrane-binding protein, partial [Candidatus Marinimicrobia bacterium]|nr:membrane-binding protein [Candidatus Neomarinimicrobiota bacterium]